jgi:hypothetical protein
MVGRCQDQDRIEQPVDGASIRSDLVEDRDFVAVESVRVVAGVWAALEMASASRAARVSAWRRV